MGPLVQHVVLVAAILALSAAALRVASLAAPRGLERAVAAAPIAGSAVVLEALGLGLFGLGGSAVALAGAAFATWLGCRLSLPRPARASRTEPLPWWRATPRPLQLAAGALLGASLAWTAWMLRHPLIGFDGVTYHLTEATAWIASGHTGASEPAFYDLPIASYPLTNEVILSWGMAISRSFVFATLLTPAMVLLLVFSGWLGLRRLRVPALASALALAAVVTVPLVVRTFNEPDSDLPASAWLVCAGALCVAARRRPALLAPALLAGGLCVGTKTTALPLAVLTLGTGLYRGRSELRRLGGALLLGAAGAALVGGVWYARNLLEHGSPFWPFVRGPWGDPAPPEIEAVKHTFLERPRATLEGRVRSYFDELGGAVALLPAAVLAPLAIRRRPVLAAAAVTALAALLWANAPVTGMGDIPDLRVLPVSSLRYLLPTIVAAVLTLALPARARRRGRLAIAVLGAAIVVNVLAVSPLSFPRGPSAPVLLAGVALGLAAAALVPRVAPALARSRVAASLVGAGAVVATGAALAVAASGYVGRHARLRSTAYSQVAGWLVSQPGFDDGDEPVASASTRPAVLAGDRLRHHVVLIPEREPCRAVALRLRVGWVVLQDTPRWHGPAADGLPSPGPTRACLRRLRPDRRLGAFRLYAPRGG